jgi:hypothetical protein
MKSKFITIGTASATAAFLSYAALAQDPARSGAQSGATSTPQGAEQQVHLEGKIVSLFEYLSGEHGMSSSSIRSSSSYSSSTSPTTTTPGQPRLNQQDTSSTSTDAQRSTDILGRDRSASTATPGASTATTGSSGAFSGTAAWAGQPLALIVDSGHAGASSLRQSSQSSDTSLQSTDPTGQSADTTRQSTDPSRESTSTSQSQSRSSSFASSHGSSGEVYVLVFDPQDASSRAAFTKAQWMASGRSSDITSPTADRLPVRGAGESDPNRQSVTERDSDATRTDTTRTDPSRLEKSDVTSSTSSRSYASAHSMGKKVKVTGKVLNKGGIKALEVASIEDSGGASESSSDTQQRSTTPRSN